MKNKIHIYVEDVYERDPRNQNIFVCVGDRNPIKIGSMKLFLDYPSYYLNIIADKLSEEVKKSFTDTFMDLFFTEESLDEPEE